MSAINFNDESGHHFKHPERSCKKCLKYPCIKGMDVLVGNFAAYGCTLFEDINTFEICRKK